MRALSTRDLEEIATAPADQVTTSTGVVNRSDYGNGHSFLLLLDLATGTEKAKLAGESGFGP